MTDKPRFLRRLKANPPSDTGGPKNDSDHLTVEERAVLIEELYALAGQAPKQTSRS